MVRKITSGEYLKRYDNMTVTERQEYLSRVGDWLSVSGQTLVQKGEVFEARLQNVLQVSAMWNDADCEAFEEGVVLLSALTGVTETKLPDILYAISAKRSIKHVFQALWKIEEAEATPVMEVPQNPDRQTVDSETIIKEQEHRIMEKYGGEPAAPFQGGTGDGAVGGGNQDGEAQVEPAADAAGAVAPARPKHIDQYVHLLPKKTQEHAALVQGLYRELDEAREKMNLLMNDQTASAADREAWAKKATKCDNTLRKIFDELDSEWAKLVKSGRVVVDDLWNARVVHAADATSTTTGGGENGAQGENEAQIENGAQGENAVGMQGEGTAEAQGENGGAQGDGTTGLTSEQKARRRELRKWLTDTRRGNGAARDERVKQWYENFREYLTLEGYKAFGDEIIKEAIEHYGIDVEKLKGGTVMTSQETEEEKPKQE